jgi:hypothetical protein
MTNDITSYASVEKWIANVNRYYKLSREEWEGRLQTLADFCRSEETDPDTMIADALAEKSEKIDYMRRLKKFMKERTVNPHVAHDLENVVRSFFIHNGARVVTRPYSDSV